MFVWLYDWYEHALYFLIFQPQCGNLDIMVFLLLDSPIFSSQTCYQRFSHVVSDASYEIR